MRVAAVVTLAMAAMPAALAQGLGYGNGTCAQDPYQPQDKTLKCIWGQLANIQNCRSSAPCTKDGNPCWWDQVCEDCAWSVKCT